MFVTERFELEDKTIDNLIPEFGYGGFGELTFYRTYSRIRKDGGQETWNDVVRRVINGVMSIRKNHYVKNHIAWDERYWQEYARKMAYSMFHMEWMPPGRGLWAMGTDFVYERGAMSLYNCAYTDIGDNIGDDISWLMDTLMNGVGVGFGPHRNDSLALHPIAERTHYTFVIDDTRESWCESVKTLIDAFLMPEAQAPTFDYSLIRKKGMPIRGFGGLASGPEPLMELHKNIITVCCMYIAKQIDSVMLKTDIANMVGCCVVAGNVRRSAEIACGPITDPTFMDLKNYNKYPYRGAHGWMSNNSVILQDAEDFERLGELAKRVIRNGEPGYINACNLPKGRIGKEDGLREDLATGFNPCLIGESKVFVADGRGYVPIKELADEGKDVPVFCIDENDKIVTRLMRNPRKTGEKVKVYKIVLDDGSTIRVTANHKFMLRNRKFVETRHLGNGDSLATVNRYLPNYDKGTYWGHYYSLCYSGKTQIEHRVMMDVENNKLIHVDHKNCDTADNRSENIQLMDVSGHLSSHSVGLTNGNSSGYSHEELLNQGVELCRKLGRRFKISEWRNSGGIKAFSNFRKERFGSMIDFSFECAELAGVSLDSGPRSVKKEHIASLEAQGYVVEVTDDTVMVHRTCENCGNDFLTRTRETCFCSMKCVAAKKDYNKVHEAVRKWHYERRLTLREEQLSVFVDLQKQLGRRPAKKEWTQACKDSQISFEISRPSSIFKTYNDLVMAAFTFNHKVDMVFEDGEEDVYNGTVDDYHNFIVGGWENTLKSGRKVQIGLINQQCGEIPLQSRETCNLAETLPTRCETIERWFKACEYACFYSSTVSLLPTHQESTNRIVARNRRIGVSIIAFTNWVCEEGLAKVTRYVRDGYKTVRSVNQWANGEAGVPEAIRVTTMKPGGTTPKLPGLPPGMSFETGEYMIRRIRVQQGSPIEALLKEAGIPNEPDVVSANTQVFEYPIKSTGKRFAHQVSLWEQASLLVLLQREWSDNAVSNTLNFRPAWNLEKIYKDGRTKYTEDGLELFDSEGNKYFYPFGSNVRVDEDLVKQECRLLRYDEGNEEDVIENVLSMIAPFTKSVALLPHTAQGVYAQMPEEVITEEEYNRRKAAIKPIDWTKFRNSDGQDEQYCSGPSCELPGVAK